MRDMERQSDSPVTRTTRPASRAALGSMAVCTRTLVPVKVQDRVLLVDESVWNAMQCTALVRRGPLALREARNGAEEVCMYGRVWVSMRMLYACTVLMYSSMCVQCASGGTSQRCFCRAVFRAPHAHTRNPFCSAPTVLYCTVHVCSSARHEPMDGQVRGADAPA